MNFQYIHLKIQIQLNNQVQYINPRQQQQTTNSKKEE